LGKIQTSKSKIQKNFKLQASTFKPAQAPLSPQRLPLPVAGWQPGQIHQRRLDGFA